MIYNPFKSLRFRIFLIVFLTGLISCLVIHSAILESYEDRAVNVRESEVSTQLMILANHLINYNYFSDTTSDVINAELDLLANLYDGRVIVIDSDLKIRKDTYGISEGKTIISDEVVRCLKNGTSGSTAVYDKNNGYIEMTAPITETLTYESGDVARELKKQDVVRGVLLISVSTDYITATMDILTRRAITIELIAIIVILVMAVYMSGRLLKPFDRITAAINDVKAGYTNEPISGANYFETEHIIQAFNQLLQRMNALDASRQEFVSNVSHELKTPITSMKVLADSLIMQDDVPNEVYRDFMEDIAAEVDRENQIINDLLELVRMDKKATPLNITSVDVVQMMEIILKRIRPIARKHNIELTLETTREITAEIDEVKLSLALMNLVENAVKYNKDDGFVKVKLDADHQYFTCEVSDSGIGIPEDSLDKIYERFYRVDKSRSREIGGTGLGLSITHNAILMHRGTIQVKSEENVGTTFTVRIPLIYMQSLE
ncbi:sensor histidine kinase [Butyrivibrio sp. VCD2006]|uniref:sensor histidine kinase n=1 Tax=Butyrivibrio sp. VCD2006 TaxID=1280664 RepID=UPI000414E7CB|nr:HAMP domain-containing sensor histidine kinase [Butyrivibrio sp. VCD2006]